MIKSANQTFSDKQAVTATAVSTNVIDLGAPGSVLGAPTALKRDIGKGVPIPIVVQLTAAATGTSPTLQVELQVSDTENFASSTVVARSGTLAGGAEGQQLAPFYIPEGTKERYMRLNYVLGGTSPNYQISAFIPLASDQNETVVGA